MRKLTTLLTITLVIIILAGCADKPHEHTFHDKWEFDDTNHWHKATCGHDEISGMAEHIFINSSDCTKTESIYKCQVCEYTKTVTERGRHSFGEDDICTVCGGYRCGDNVAAIFDSSNKTLTLRGTGDMFGYTDSDVRKWADLKFEALIVEHNFCESYVLRAETLGGCAH